MSYKFAILSPLPTPAAAEANDAVFADGAHVLGIEVTVPALAARCGLGNIDPQHTGGDASTAAIQAVLSLVPPEDGATLATVRPDLDSIGAMALLGMRLAAAQAAMAEVGRGGPMDGVDPWVWQPTGELAERIHQVADADTFGHGNWPGPQALPTQDNPWAGQGSADSVRGLAAINAAVADHTHPLAERVDWMSRWLLAGEEPAGYRERVEAERLDMVQALEDGRISWVCHTMTTPGHLGQKIATVESTHRGAMSVGYKLAPIVIALNPAFRFGAGEPHRKFTVAQFCLGHLDLRAALAELSQLEPGWGGSPTIAGSPQGVNSTLSVDQVVEVVSRHLS